MRCDLTALAVFTLEDGSRRIIRLTNHSSDGSKMTIYTGRIRRWHYVYPTELTICSILSSRLSRRIIRYHRWDERVPECGLPNYLTFFQELHFKYMFLEKIFTVKWPYLGYKCDEININWKNIKLRNFFFAIFYFFFNKKRKTKLGWLFRRGAF